jgi:2Fe-2S ferredoxin
MPKVTYVLPNECCTEVEVPVGMSLMQAAVDNCIEGIAGTCGGSMSCATCHLFVEHSFADRLPIPSAAEDQALNYTLAARQSNSRLGCQIIVTEVLTGITVQVPASNI